ncbi:MAG: peptide-methionine (S)-S-oxide reductase [Deltaproteobacteria bacterium]|nr:MAG: peptide-methionine (S)-S-oxide reductase [Deltaproteobacteria bacterium]
MTTLKKSLLSLLLFSTTSLASGTYEGGRCPDSVFLKPEKKWKVATFAGGCFWCTQQAFDKIQGVHHTWVGFSGGHAKNPTYQQVTAGKTGHLEVVRVFYTTTYEKILDVFWKNINPMDDGGQFVDRGESYKSAIFYHHETQKNKAIESLEKIKRLPQFSGKIMVTKILPVKEFYQAENYHQKYYKCSPFKYKYYKSGSGRSEFFKKYWQKN